MYRNVLARPGIHVILFIGATLLLYFGIAIAGRTLQLYELQQAEARLQQQIAALETQRQELLHLKDQINSDQYVERVAREQLGFVKPGELGVMVLSSTTAPVPEAPVAEVRPDTRANWERWRAWILQR